jgi:hypothetical protein
MVGSFDNRRVSTSVILFSSLFPNYSIPKSNQFHFCSSENRSKEEEAQKAARWLEMQLDHDAAVSTCKRNLMPTYVAYCAVTAVKGMMEVSKRRPRTAPWPISFLWTSL